MNDNALPRRVAYIYMKLFRHILHVRSFLLLYVYVYEREREEILERPASCRIDTSRKVASAVYPRMIKVYHLFASDRKEKSGVSN